MNYDSCRLLYLRGMKLQENGEECVMKRVIFLLHVKCYYNDIKQDDVGSHTTRMRRQGTSTKF